MALRPTRGAARKARLAAMPPAIALIDSFTHDGRGVAHVDGKAVFIDCALPGEEVEFTYTLIRRDYAEGRLDRIVSASPHRVEAPCPWFAACGGCRLQHLARDEQIALKQGLLLEQLQRIGQVKPEAALPPLVGEPFGYRRKARLGVKYVPKRGRVLVGFREKASALLAAIDSCAVLHPAVGTRIAELGEMIHSLSIRDQIPQIEVAAGDEQVALVFRVLADLSPDDLNTLQRFAAATGLTLHLQRGGPASITPLLQEQPQPLAYRLPEQDITFEFSPTEFTQINQDINRRMVNRVLDLLDLQASHEVLDLFCGLGNFTLPIARRVARVTGVEGELGLVERARANARLNGIATAEFHVADLFQPQTGVPWIDRPFDRVLMDPSRSGGREILSCVPRWRAPRLVYVSCNPATLARDAGVLVHEHGYRLTQAGIMDMFPHTAHVESVAVFER